MCILELVGRKWKGKCLWSLVRLVTNAHKSHCLVGSSKESDDEFCSLVLQASYMGEDV